MTVNLQKLVAGGVIIATGTDAGNTGTQHASSYFIELNAMQQAGMNNWQLLEASTINGAKALGQDKKEWGSIAKGKNRQSAALYSQSTRQPEQLAQDQPGSIKSDTIRPN